MNIYTYYHAYVPLHYRKHSSKVIKGGVLIFQIYTHTARTKEVSEREREREREGGVRKAFDFRD